MDAMLEVGVGAAAGSADVSSGFNIMRNWTITLFVGLATTLGSAVLIFPFWKKDYVLVSSLVFAASVMIYV